MSTYLPQKHSMVKEENKRKEEARGNDLTVDPNAPDAILNCVLARIGLGDGQCIIHPAAVQDLQELADQIKTSWAYLIANRDGERYLLLVTAVTDINKDNR
jgi:hypothetical protein